MGTKSFYFTISVLALAALVAGIWPVVAGAADYDESVALARQSGCMACHSIDRKVVGPGWKDVADKYSGDSAVRARLIEKVKKGGKGNWVAVTGGVPMPPYSPRVSDSDIGKLVDFILGLESGA